MAYRSELHNMFAFSTILTVVICRDITVHAATIPTGTTHTSSEYLCGGKGHGRARECALSLLNCPPYMHLSTFGQVLLYCTVPCFDSPCW
ncbi:hypothetical protein HOY80DRAFT_969078 [Tuber brumale]|nr:hypothetical protein HOY80DRAFT_969078 [Tuber brumale]